MEIVEIASTLAIAMSLNFSISCIPSAERTVSILILGIGHHSFVSYSYLTLHRRYIVIRSSPRSTHSTDAKKALRSLATASLPIEIIRISEHIHKDISVMKHKCIKTCFPKLC